MVGNVADETVCLSVALLVVFVAVFAVAVSTRLYC